MTPEQRAALRALYAQIEGLRDIGEDYLILSVGAHGPNSDMPEGNAVATVRIGDDMATSEAKYLDDAVSLARAKIIRERDEAKAARKEARDAARLARMAA